jgi:hypothetical protein
VDARPGQDFARYAVYSPELTADAGIEAEDVEFASGTFRLINPTVKTLKQLSELGNVSLYYNQSAQVIVSIEAR